VAAHVSGGAGGSAVRVDPASPEGTPAGVPRFSNDKPHTLVPAFTRDSAY